MTIELLDTFTESNDTLIGSHTPDQGTAGWTTNASLLVVASIDKLKNTSTSGANSQYIPVASLGNSKFDITGTLNGATSGYELRVVLTTTTGSPASGYRVGIAGDGTVSLYRDDAGVYTAIGSSPYSIPAFNSATEYKLSLVVDNGTVKALLNDSVVLTASDAAYTSFARAIVYIFNPAASTTVINSVQWASAHSASVAATAQPATAALTLAVSRPHALTIAASAQPARSALSMEKFTPGAHDLTINAIAVHGASNLTMDLIQGKEVFIEANAQAATAALTLTLTRAPSQFIAKFDSLTGTPKVQILRVRDATTYDSSDSTYKASPTLAHAQITMSQVQATLWPTYYKATVYTTDWTDGEYITHAVDDGDSTNYRFDSYIYKDGALYYGGLLSDERAAVFSSAAQSGLLTDAEHNQLMALPTNPLLTTDVRLDDLDVPISGVAAASLAALETSASYQRIDSNTTITRKIATNDHVLNKADGTIIWLDDDNVTPWMVCHTYSDALVSSPYNGTAAIHHTTMLVPAP